MSKAGRLVAQRHLMASDTKNKNDDLQRQPSPLLRRARLEMLLRERILPQLPCYIRGQQLTREEKEEILGLGPEGC